MLKERTSDIYIPILLQLSSVAAFSFSLLSRLGKKLADGKGGLGCEGNPQAISRAREALMLSLGSQIERMQPEVRRCYSYWHSSEIIYISAYCNSKGIAACICAHYKKLETEEKKHFLALLAGDLGVKHDDVHTNAQRLLDTFTQVRPCVWVGHLLSVWYHSILIFYVCYYYFTGSKEMNPHCWSLNSHWGKVFGRCTGLSSPTLQGWKEGWSFCWTWEKTCWSAKLPPMSFEAL